MKTKNILFSFMLMFFIFSGIQSAYASNSYNFHFKSYDALNLNQVDFEAFQCQVSGGSCEHVLSNYHFSANSNSATSLQYLARGTSSPTDYAIYFYREGYLPKKGVIRGDWGTGQTVNYNVIFEKKDVCNAPIVSYTVEKTTHSHEPLEIGVETKLDAETASAFRFTTINPHYKPDSWFNEFAHLFSAETKVTLEVLNSDGVVIYTDSDVKFIFAEETENYNFTWTPEDQGTFTLKVTSEVVDSQCITTVPTSNSKITTVLEERPQNMYYTILRNLEYSPAHPIEDQNIEGSVEFLSNFADEFYNLFPVDTKLLLDVRKGKSNPFGEVVYSREIVSSASANFDEFKKEHFEFAIGNSGWYTVYVVGSANNPDSGYPVIQDLISAEIYISQKPIDKYNFDFIIKDAENGNLIESAKVTLSTGSVVLSNQQGVASFISLSPAIYGFTVEKEGYDTKTGSFTIVDSDGSINVYLTPEVIEPETYSVKFIVRNSNDNSLIENAYYIKSNDLVGLTNLNGELLFDDVSIGTHPYFVVKEGYFAAYGDFEITNANKIITVYLTPEVIEPETYSVKFIVRNS